MKPIEKQTEAVRDRMIDLILKLPISMAEKDKLWQAAMDMTTEFHRSIVKSNKA